SRTGFTPRRRVMGSWLNDSKFISSDCWAVATTDPDLPDFNRAERCVLRAFLHRTLCCAEPPPPNAALCGGIYDSSAPHSVREWWGRSRWRSKHHPATAHDDQSVSRLANRSGVQLTRPPH